MTKAMGVTKLMHGLLDSPLQEEGFIRWQPIEVLPQARQGDDSLSARHISLAEDEVEARSV